MNNIWADSFSEIRELSLQEKKEEKKEGKPKRWWDDDGDGVGYEKGEVSGKFKKTKKEGKDYDPMEDPEFDHDEAEKNRGVSGKNNPKGGKKLKKEEVEIEEGMKQARKNVGASKCWDGYKAQGTKKKGGKEVPNCVPEERELTSKKSNGDKIDVMQGKNKIEINPKLSEEIQEWVGELLDEGYDLSQFTPEEIVDIYESADLVEEMDSTQLAMAKAQAARAKVKKEREDLRVAQMQQKTKYDASEAVLSFVNERTPLFEGVFDPKKSKLRPASERSQNSMTDAQRKAAKKESERVAAIHSKGETVLAGMRSSGKKGKVQTKPAPKSKAPEANRSVRGKSDKLASAAEKILKDLKK